MKTVTNLPSFQGDLCIRKVEEMPKGLSIMPSENGHFVLAHSETGHHHVVLERSAQAFIDQTNEFIAYLQVLEPTELEHLRSFDTHESLHLEPGIYEVRRQREHTPEGWRRAAD